MSAPQKIKLSISDITFDGKQGDYGIINLGEYGHLEVGYDKDRREWSFRLYDDFENKPLTSRTTFKKLESLRANTRKTKGIRELLKALFKNYEVVIEGVLMVIQNNIDEWDVESKAELADESSTFPAEEEVEAEVSRILDSENMLEAVKKHLDNIVVGEDINKIAIFVLLLGSKYDSPQMKQMILLKGSEGGGKSTLMSLARCYKVKEVGRFSAHALDYSNFEGFEVLMLKELGSMDMEKQGVSTLKFLSSDDRGYTVEITVRNEETGRFTTTEYRIPPITLISSTTRLELDPQFQRRAWLFNIDETPEQTSKVLKFKALLERQNDEKLLGIRKVTDYEFSFEVLKRLVARINPPNVIIPFQYALSGVLGHRTLRIRGDISKLYAFLRLYGVLNLKRLLKCGDVYFLTPEVCVEALNIIAKPLANMIFKLEKRLELVFDVLDAMELNNAGDVITKADRDRITLKLREITGKGSDKTTRRLLASLENSGYLSSMKVKNTKQWQLLYSLDTIRRKKQEELEILSLSNSFMIKMAKEAAEWSKTCLDKLHPAVGVFFSTYQLKDGKVVRLSLNEVEKLIADPNMSISEDKLVEVHPKISEEETEKICPTVTGSLSKANLTANKPPLRKRTLKDWTEAKSPEKTKPVSETKIDLSQFYICNLCKRQGKEMFFGTKQDLKTHLLRIHGVKLEEEEM